MYFKVLAGLFLASVSPAFLPSKKACGTHQFRHWGVRQQYPEVFPDTRTRCGTRHNSLTARITPLLSESLYEIERRTGRSVRPTVEPSGRKRRRRSRHEVRSLDALPLLRPLALRRAA